ncbi:Cell division protein FtsN [Candidatus Entotheonellaceae bacterium PAL068K]
MVLNPVQLGLAVGFVAIGLMVAFGAGFIVGMWYQDSDRVTLYRTESPSTVRRPADRPMPFSVDSTASKVPGSVSGARQTAVGKRVPLPAQRPAVPALPQGVSSSGVRYIVQVGSFRVRDQAERLRQRLAKQNYPVRIQTSVAPDRGIWHRVRVGPFPDRGAADRVAQRLGSQEQLPVIVMDVAR